MLLDPNDSLRVGVRKCYIKSRDTRSEVKGNQQAHFFSDGENLIYPALSIQATFQYVKIAWLPLIS